MRIAKEALDESKAHFDELKKNLGADDLLLVLIWRWTGAEDGLRVFPVIEDHFIGSASGVAELRDQLHLARGGSFVEAGKCDDSCEPEQCSHVGEPLNASDKRERKSGPESTRPSQNVSFAANFGGLVRMLKTNSDNARTVFRKIRGESDVSDSYISFIHRWLSDEEKNQYLPREWLEIAGKLGVEVNKEDSLDKLFEDVRTKGVGYQGLLRELR